MNKDEFMYIYEDLLRKNIEKISFYKNQENEQLNKYVELLNSGLESYKSDTNTHNIENNIDNLSDSLSDIELKRKRYIEILEKVIILYNNLKNKTTERFTHMGQIDRS